MIIVATICMLCVQVFGEKKTYENYAVFSLFPEASKQSEVIQELVHEYDIWKYPSSADDSMDVMVPPQKRYEFQIFLERTGTINSIKSDNIQRLIDFEEDALKSRSRLMDWKNYHELEVIYNWLDDICRNYTFVKCINGGKSYENRTIRGIEINFGKNLTGVFIEAGIHAREWISPSSTSWMVKEILKSPSDSIFRKFNYIYFPVFNPDGYVYAWTSNRLWRKTRTPYKTAGGMTCHGADPNRNWDFRWNEVPSNDPCSETYAGPKPFSEIEMKTISDYIKSVKKPKNLDIYLTFHSYGQLLLYPWGHTKLPAPNRDLWKKIGEVAAKELGSVHGKTLTVGQTGVILYLTSGTSRDWFYGTYNSTIAFTIEMRDRGAHGFILPPDQIIPNSEEYFAALKAILKEHLKIKK